jgi:hypothetical protein
MAFGAHNAIGESIALDVQDISFLWPVPETKADVDSLIGATDDMGNGETLFPAAIMTTLLTTAETMGGSIPSGKQFMIQFTPAELREPSSWKVAGIRVDGSAPGSHQSSIANFGSRPQIRLILQPITVRDNKAEVHDFAAHLVYDFILPDPNGSQRGVPDRAKFKAIVRELAGIKAELQAAGVSTAGPLGVHPGFRHDRRALTERLRTLLRNHLPGGTVNTVAFMGVERPEPWMFFLMAKNAGGSFEAVPVRSIGQSKLQLLSFLGGTAIVPAPTTSTFGSQGVSTTSLFDAGQDLGQPVFPTATDARIQSIRFQDIPAIIANPEISNVINTDCVSCHTETTRRAIRGIVSTSAFEYQLPERISGVDTAVLPTLIWNVRNFGWFKNAATVVRRTANEAAESVDYINKEYVMTDTTGPNPGEPLASTGVANPLTLVMRIKSPQDAVKLKTLVLGMQALPPDQNPITKALDEIGTVHFARFVFLDENTLAVITTYDGEFDDYIFRFVDKIGHIFDLLLAHVDQAPPTPVKDHPQEFLAYIKAHDLKSAGPLYSAYPALTTQRILELQRKANASP